MAETKLYSKCEQCPAYQRSIFAHLEGEVPDNAFQSEVRQFAAGDKLTFTTGSSSGFYCIKEGTIRIIYSKDRKENTVALCGPGDLIGYGKCFEEGTQTAVASSKVSACFVDHSSFLKFQQNSKSATDVILKRLCDIISESGERIAGLQSYSVKSRVASMLLQLSRKFGKVSDRGTILDIDIDRKVMAQLSGTVIESLARALTDLESDKTIVRLGRKICIVNLEKLKTEACS